MNIQGIGALVYGAMVIAILCFSQPSTVSVLALCGATFAYIASVAGFIFERGHLRSKLAGNLNLLFWLLSMTATCVAIYIYVYGA